MFFASDNECTAVHIMCPHVLGAASSAAVQLFAQNDSDNSGSTSMLLVHSQQDGVALQC